MKTTNTNLFLKAVLQGALEYGCSSVMADLADAVMPYRTKPLKRKIKRLSMSLLGTYAGSWCGDMLFNDISRTFNAVREMEDEAQDTADQKDTP